MQAGGIEQVPRLHRDLMGETRWMEFKGQRSEGRGWYAVKEVIIKTGGWLAGEGKEPQWHLTLLDKSGPQFF